MADNSSLLEIARVIRERDNFVITSHINPDGDNIGSQLGLFLLLKQMGKGVRCVDADEVPSVYSFLPASEEVMVLDDKDIGDLSVFIIVDTADYERLGRVAPLLELAELVINIDHHISNNRYGDLNYVDEEAAAVGEQIYELAKVLEIEITKDIAECLFTAIISDTGCFRYENTTPRTHRIAAELIEAGVNSRYVVEMLYETKSFSSLKLLGEALFTLQLGAQGKVAWATVYRKMMEEVGATYEDLEGLVEQIGTLKGLEIAVLFKELDGRVKVSFRSKGNRDVNKLASLFGGGGHPNAAGCSLELEIEEARELVISKISEIFS